MPQGAPDLLTGMRPFRFLATADGNLSFAELTSLARKAEAVGCPARPKMARAGQWRVWPATDRHR